MPDNSTYTNKILLPKTGRTISYANYDDGYFQKGNPVSPRFVDNGDGTVSDRATNLMWPKDTRFMIPGATGIVPTNMWTTYRGAWANSTSYTAGVDAALDSTTYWVCVVSHTSAGTGTFADDRTANPTYWRQTLWYKNLKGDAPTMLTWTQAITSAEALEFAGYSDWRVPNFLEAVNLGLGIDLITYFPSYSGTYALQGWTSTTDKYTTTEAYSWYNHVTQSMSLARSAKIGDIYHNLLVRGGN